MNSGQALKQYLKDNGIKQAWLARQLKISEARVSNMLKVDLQFRTLIKICEILRLNIDEFEKLVNKKEDTVIRPRTSVSSKTEI